MEFGIHTWSNLLRKKITDEWLKELVSDSLGFADVLRKAGRVPSGGNITHISKRIKKLGYDTSHFLGSAWNKGKTSGSKLESEKILVVMPEGSHRQKAYLLRRALIDSGVPHVCKVCGIDSWLGNSIVLEIDHIDGNYLNNTLENLRFLCPNCHSQTSTFCYKKR